MTTAINHNGLDGFYGHPAVHEHIIVVRPNKKYVWFRLPYLPLFFIPTLNFFSPFLSNCSPEKEYGRQDMRFKGFFSLTLTLLHSERPTLYTILAFLSAKGLKDNKCVFKGHKDHIFLHYFLSFFKLSKVFICNLRQKSFQKKK